MTLVLWPLVIALAVLAIVAPRLFGGLMRFAAGLAVLAFVYIVDGQTAHPWFLHDHAAISAAVR